MNLRSHKTLLAKAEPLSKILVFIFFGGGVTFLPDRVSLDGISLSVCTVEDSSIEVSVVSSDEFRGSFNLFCDWDFLVVLVERFFNVYGFKAIDWYILWLSWRWLKSERFFILVYDFERAIIWCLEWISNSIDSYPDRSAIFQVIWNERFSSCV